MLVGVSSAIGIVNQGMQTTIAQEADESLAQPEAPASTPPGDAETPGPSTEYPAVYKTFNDKKDGCIKIVLKP